MYGALAGVSSSALYRHRRALHHAPRAFAVALPGERSSDLVSALVDAVSTARSIKDTAEARGSEALALRAAAEVRAGTTALADRLGVVDESVAETLAYHHRLLSSLMKACALEPSFGDLLAAGAEALGDREIKDDALSLAINAREFRSRTAT